VPGGSGGVSGTPGGGLALTGTPVEGLVGGGAALVAAGAGLVYIGRRRRRPSPRAAITTAG